MKQTLAEQLDIIANDFGSFGQSLTLAQKAEQTALCGPPRDFAEGLGRLIYGLVAVGTVAGSIILTVENVDRFLNNRQLIG